MKKVIFILFVLLVGVSGFLVSYLVYTGGLFFYAGVEEPGEVVFLQEDEPIIITGNYVVYVDEQPLGGFEDFEQALAAASGYERAGIIEDGKPNYLWDNYPPFQVVTMADDLYVEFETLPEAVEYAKTRERVFIYYRKNNALIWTDFVEIPVAVKIEGVPLLYQLPELPRGCEVTSLAMLLNYWKNSVDKLTLAREVKKDETPYSVQGGKIHTGNPNTGFVGDMFSTRSWGFGVYHGPIFDLLSTYMPAAAMDLTGCDFEQIIYLLAHKSPVWVVTNTSYKALPENQFHSWVTPTGEIRVTYSEHAVVVTGYDEEYIYFNDPLQRANKAPKKEFIEAWIQMGRQAVACTP